MQGRALSRQRLKGCSSRQCTQRPVSAWTHTRPRAAPKGAKGARSRLVVRAGPVEIDEEDLMQIPDRLKWYDVKYAADDMPDWNPARFVSSTQMGPGVRHIVLEVEISRERVPLRNAYKCAGQRAVVRINSGVEEQAPVCSAPHSVSLNKDSLFKVRGDLFAHEIKLPKEPISVMAPVELLVSKEDSPELYKLQEDDSVEVGPFQGAGLALKDSPIMAIYRYPTLVLFVSGQGIAAAKALLGCSPEVPNMHLKFRKSVCMFYKVPNDASICFREELSTWETQHHCRVVTTTGSFQDAFDDDDKLAYDPEYTGAIVLTGGDEEAEKAALAVCREAEIGQVLTDTLEAAMPVYLDSTPKSFQRWAKKKDPVVSE